ncbi:type II toxin-antitoxin system VapB family antitoxin [Sphingomonas pokkalii]|uniref:PSK operon transcription factor n=1 Tax=Sphingomonas pokkalii TaxID=2175090 RepID=A0A2U0SBK7_9SPHN|nr:type II toxin-antitoxin system VapB family antitoxin [Sphingomonas pokkalii]PVX28655.1 PSK operon transcription factor [Sphingomonas pokkalii]
MALSIKDEETDQLVRRYARAKGVSYTMAIRMAVREAMDRDRSGADSFADRLKRAQAIAASQPRTDRTADDIVGYDEHGLPR